MDSLADYGPRRIGLEELEYFDEPSPEDAAELDSQVWRHIDSLLVGFDGRCDDEDEDDEDEDEDDFDDGHEDDEDPGPVRPGTPADVGLPDPDPVLDEAPKVGPVLAARPISGVLDQLALRFAGGPIASPTTDRPGPRYRDRSRPGDAPGWKGGSR